MVRIRREFENHGSSKANQEETKKLGTDDVRNGNLCRNLDPELKQLEVCWKNILDIQYPAMRTGKALKQTPEINKGKSSTVNVKKEVIILSLQQNTQRPLNSKKSNSFYSIDENLDFEQNSIEANNHETQTIVNGSIIKLRLKPNTFIQGTPFQRTLLLVFVP